MLDGVALRRVELARVDHGPTTLRIRGRGVNGVCYDRQVDRFDAFVAALSAELPGFRIVRKDHSRFQRAIHYALFAVTLGRMRGYLDQFQTTIGRTVYVTPDWDDWDADRRYVTLRHEAIHLRQFHRLTLPVMVLLYIFIPLPMGLAYFRARFEKAAYAESVRAAAEVWGPAYPKRPEYREHVIEQFVGPSYGWMWPFRQHLERWYDGILATLDERR